MYSNDYDDWIVPQGKKDVLEASWPWQLSSLNLGLRFNTKNAGDFICASEPCPPDPATGRYSWGHFTANARLTGLIATNGNVDYKQQKTNVVINSSTAIFSADTLVNNPAVTSCTQFAFRHGSGERPDRVYELLPDKGWAASPYTNIKGFVNICYFDGHAATHNGKYMLDSNDDRKNCKEGIRN